MTILSLAADLNHRMVYGFHASLVKPQFNSQLFFLLTAFQVCLVILEESSRSR